MTFTRQRGVGARVLFGSGAAVGCAVVLWVLVAAAGVPVLPWPMFAFVFLFWC